MNWGSFSMASSCGLCCLVSTSMEPFFRCIFLGGVNVKHSDSGYKRAASLSFPFFSWSLLLSVSVLHLCWAGQRGRGLVTGTCFDILIRFSVEWTIKVKQLLWTRKLQKLSLAFGDVPYARMIMMTVCPIVTYAAFFAILRQTLGKIWNKKQVLQVHVMSMHFLESVELCLVGFLARRSYVLSLWKKSCT